MLVKPQWVIFISTSGTSANNTGVTSSLLFSPDFPHARTLVVTSYHAFILIMTTARDSPVMAL